MFKKLSALALIAFLFILPGCQAGYDGPPADLVVMNANVVTIDKDHPRAQAVAVIGEEIVAVTTNDAIQTYIGDDTEVIDAAGRLMIPGFNDAHAHFGPLDPDYVDQNKDGIHDFDYSDATYRKGSGSDDLEDAHGRHVPNNPQNSKVKEVIKSNPKRADGVIILTGP